MDAIQPAIASREPLDAFIGGCARCGYNLRGLVDPRCPECGLAFDVGNSWPRRWIQWRGEAMRRGLWALGGAVVTSVSFCGDLPFQQGGSSGPDHLFLAGGWAGLMGIVGVALGAMWVWEEICNALARLAVGGEVTSEHQTDSIVTPPPRFGRSMRIFLGVIAAILVMCLWLPLVILSPLWLPPVALLMFWVEHRRTQARLAGALLTPYSIDTRRQFAGYLRWGCVLSVFAAVGWIGCLFAL